jgi:hypothetical protein
MTIKLLDTIVLEKDFPDQGLKRGDIGAIVEIYEPDGLEVEFVTGSGKTQALITLKTTDVRCLTDTDILSVRSLKAA